MLPDRGEWSHRSHMPIPAYRPSTKKVAPKKTLPKKKASPPRSSSFGTVWHPKLESEGFTQVSNYFLLNYHRLEPYDLTHGEAMFVIHLMQHKWTTEAPYPAYKTIAKRMVVSVKTARRYAQSLEQKKYLKREMRVGVTNKFHFTKLITALVALKDKDAKESADHHAKRRRP